MKITVCRKAHFNSAHKLANNNWSKEKNYDIFGKCSYENYHGHNYELIVKLTGDIDPETGMLMDLSVLKKIESFTGVTRTSASCPYCSRRIFFNQVCC